MMTAGLVAKRKREYLIIAIAWFTVDVLFEIGQGFGNSVIQIIPDWFSDFLFLENTTNYFLYGQFDRYDILSIALGSLAAYILLIRTNEDGEKHEK